MSKAKKPGGATARYADLKAKWEVRHRGPDAGGGDWLVDKPELSLDAAPFLQTLRALGGVTQDRRFTDLHSWIMGSGLVDLATGRWSRYRTTLTNPVTRDVCQMIEDLVAAGETSERLAIAEAVAEFAIGALSFESACKALKRVLDEFRKIGETKRGLKKSHAKRFKS